MPFQAMETELRNYVKQTRYNIVRGHFERKLELDTTTEATVLSEAEAQAYLGDLLLHSNRADAYTYLEKAVKLDPNVAMAHASLGMAYFREGKVKEARASLERAVAANSQNYLAHYYYAFTLSRSSPDEGPVFGGYPPEMAAKIREHLQKAIALRPDYPESYNLLAYVALVTGKEVDESIASLKRVLSQSPGMHNISFMLGQLYAQKGDFKTAIELLGEIAKSNADERIKNQSDRLMSQLRTIEEKRAQYETVRRTRDSAPGLVMKTEQEKEEPTDPSHYLREALRKPAAGETQLQATLVKIECDAKGIVFVVQTATGLLKLRTAGFEDIEITTYDSNMQGEITCGERKPANPVIVCYIPNTDKKLKVDGTLKSIEFVPSDFKLKP
jgi:tetratricopeptide (TPR) repeat protein